MNSALYEGWVSHRRLSPRAHAFRYRMSMLYLDLAEQDALFALSPFAGRERFSAFSFREQDYLPCYTRNGMALADAVNLLLVEALGYAPGGAIRLLTQARNWGLAFNPVSFFFCFDEHDTLAAILCEVTNTPWRERFHYVLPCNEHGVQQFSVAKAFHVSPFLPPDLEYRMRFTAPGQHLNITMQDWHGPQKVFEAGLGLNRIALTRSTLHRQLIAFPWMSAKTVTAIYWQALRLLLKRTPIFSHYNTQRHLRVARNRSEDVDHEEP